MDFGLCSLSFTEAPPLLKVLNYNRLEDSKVETVVTRRPAHFLQIVDGRGRWVPVSSLEPWKPRVISVPLVAQRQHGILSVASSLRKAFLGRAKVLKEESGVVVGKIRVKIVKPWGPVRNGWLCPHCELEHWGSVACFLNETDRKAFGKLVFMNTHVACLLRLKSSSVEVAKTRAGSAWM